MKSRNTYTSTARRLSKIVALAALMIAGAGVGPEALARTQSLPSDIAKHDDKLIKYAHSKNKRGSDGKEYDIKVQYGRASTVVHRTEPRRRSVVAFTRVLISPAGQNDYRKPSADRLTELFPGSFVYTSLNASLFKPRGGNFTTACRKKSWHKSSKYTTYVTMKKTICSSKGMESGHRARIGNEMLVDGKAGK
ncbi:MAG: hypothetical protein AAGJ87_08030 [Pseudomonadota bacterium]